MQNASTASQSRLTRLRASAEDEIDAAFVSAVQRGAGALLVGGDAFFNSRRAQLTVLAARLGYFDLEQKTLQPLDNPFGTRLSPMS
jgi:hypothetical protein